MREKKKQNKIKLDNLIDSVKKYFDNILMGIWTFFKNNTILNLSDGKVILVLEKKF